MNFQQGWLMQLEPILVHGLAITNNFTKTHYDLNMEGTTNNFTKTHYDLNIEGVANNFTKTHYDLNIEGVTNNFTKIHYDLNMEGSTTLLLEHFVVHCHSYMKTKISPKLSKSFFKIGTHLLFHKFGCP
jgi:hypothetical protein